MSELVLPFRASNYAHQAPTGRGFRSFKCSEPIEYVRRVSRDALIQASLEPEVTRLAPLRQPHQAPSDAFFVFLTTTPQHRCAIALSEKSHGVMFDPPSGCDVAITISAKSILCDPIVSTARLIWSRRSELVAPAWTVKLLRRLKEAPGGERLIDLEGELGQTSEKWIDWTMALACRGLVTMDYRQALTDATLVKLGPLADQSAPGRPRHWLS